MNRHIRILLVALVLMFTAGCVYYNTFYNARKAFSEAESKRKQSGRRSVSNAGNSQYKKAIEKSDKVLEKYPGSSWYDDALYVNGVSHFYTGDYAKAEKRFRELIANFPQSPFYKMSNLYLAKSKLMLNEMDDAMFLFEELFSESQDREIKIDAALALGEYYFDEKNYDKAVPYFQALIDSLGNDEEKILAQMYIADGDFQRFKLRQALEDYGKLLKYDLATPDYYKVNFRLGETHYFLNDIEAGMEYFQKLSENELYYDSLASLKMKIAQGYEWVGDLMLAESIYEQVALEYPRHPLGGLANYYLGLMYQYDYENYMKAKEYYDKAKTSGNASGIYQEALEHSTDIGKLEEYLNQRSVDSTATAEEIDKAAETQYLLAELYLTQMDKPDSAIQEFQLLVEKFPTAYLTPKSLIAMAMLSRDVYNDTTVYDSTLRIILRDYPRSDFVPEAINLLGLSGTIADSGYAEKYYQRAEYFVFDNKNIDSARYYFSMVADSFPRSQFNIQAKYALLWLREMYDSPDDSTLYYEYAYFADSFPKTDFAKAAEKKLVIKPRIQKDEDDQQYYGEDSTAYAEGDGYGDGDSTEIAANLTPEQRYFTGPDGNTLFEVQGAPTRYDKEFIYPTAAYYLEFEGNLYFQIKIDPFGDVTEAKLMNPTESVELNEEATETVLSSHFDTFWIRPEWFDDWFVYKYYIPLPSRLR
nr:tetratricopeptide repeat protein [candidate division Zixibacteria bacterium]